MNNESAIAESQLHSPHYLKSVTELGDDRPTFTTHDIYSARGVKLLNAGVRVDSTVYQHLLHHKLIVSLDESLATDDTVTNQVVVDDAEFLMAFDTRLQMMRAAMPDDRALTDTLRKIPLNTCTAFKLTVMRAKRLELFQHSLFVALVSIYIGKQSNLNERQLVQLATAALMHDIGIMHIDPKLLDRSHIMTETERHHLYAHPLTAWMILKEFPEYSSEVLDGVLQHHERLDGSGYPRGLHGESIGTCGQIIAVAEIVASRYGKEEVTRYDWLRLETILKLNSRRYGRHLVGYLKVFYTEETEFTPLSDEEKQRIRQRLLAVSSVLIGWESMQGKGHQGHLFDFIDHRMQDLRVAVLDAGLDPYSVEKDTLAQENDPRACSEADILLEEAIWQIQGIMHEARRRWPEIDCEAPSPDLVPVCAWIKDTETLLHFNTAIAGQPPHPP